MMRKNLFNQCVGAVAFAGAVLFVVTESCAARNMNNVATQLSSTINADEGREPRMTDADSQSDAPNPSLSPEQVITIQLEALQHNDQTAPDGGIRIAFRFASPSNKEVTGPVERFILLVKSPLYRSMLNHKSVARGALRVTGNQARQRVTLTAADNTKAVYLFTLSKQTVAPYKDCWMTDGVERLQDDQDDAGAVAKSNGHARRTSQT